MDLPDWSSSDQDYSNDMSESHGFDVAWSGSSYSYVYVEHRDADMTSTDPPGRNHQREGLEHRGQQNNLHHNQLGYSPSSTSTQSYQPGAGHPNTATVHSQPWTQRFAPEYFVHPFPLPTLGAGSSGNDQHPQYMAPAAFNDQEPLPTQDDTSYYMQSRYNFPDNIGSTYSINVQGNGDTVPTYTQRVEGAMDGPWSTENQEHSHQTHLKSHVNRLVGVINTYEVPNATRSGGTSGSDLSLLDYNNNGQDWGVASQTTIRLDDAQQRHQVEYSNYSQFRLPVGNQAGFSTLPSRAMAQPDRLVTTSMPQHLHLLAPRRREYFTALSALQNSRDLTGKEIVGGTEDRLISANRESSTANIPPATRATEGRMPDANITINVIRN
ncbi:hypothetical protein G6011_10026 [Alternaria panax]|uniref:Uncharacterized protein n=1 Tax=Alternaria panax TaxID=48097 RepID=A0AAD4FDP2_9PLEO|nr:hypothetical protein G6011_10026 [Alternaria panax]